MGWDGMGWDRIGFLLALAIGKYIDRYIQDKEFSYQS
jgi:hypothetical protein